MTSMHVVFSLGLILSTSVFAETDFQKWKTKDEVFKRELSVIQAEGRANAGRYETEAGKLRTERYKELLKKQAISESEFRSERHKGVHAQLDKQKAEAELTIAKGEVAIANLAKECESGKESACQQAVQEHAQLFKAREALANIAIARANEDIELAQFYYEAYKYLVDKTKLDPSVAEEAGQRLNARREELRAAQGQLQLVKSIQQAPSFSL